jgi:hypothetical protein
MNSSLQVHSFANREPIAVKFNTMASNRPCPNCEKDYKAIQKIRDFNIVPKMRSNAFSFETVVELLKTSKSELQECDEEIKRLKARIFALEGRKKKLEGYVTSMRQLLSPIRKLPLDILGSIFQAANSAAVIGDGNSDSVPAKLLTGVCSYWRTLALGMPSLWSNIQLNVDFEREQQQTNLLMTILMLSRTSPLILSIKCDPKGYFGYAHGNERRHTAIDKLLEESSRWQEVSFCVHYELLVAIFRNFRGKFQSLKSLQLLCLSCSATNSSLSVFETAPRLSQLVLLPLSLLIPMPYNQITHTTLMGEPARFGEVLEIIRRCANLTDITIAYSRPTVLSLPTAIIRPLPDRIFQSNIQSFMIYFEKSLTQDDLALFERVMSCIELPLLNTIAVSSADQTPQTLRSSWGIVIDTFRSLLSRSQCHITKLTIMNLPIDSSHFLSLLSCLSQLEELELHYDTSWQILSDAVVSQLRVDEVSTLPQAVLLPRLRNIIFTIASNYLSDGVLFDMIASRSDPFDEEGEDSVVVRLNVVRVCVKDRRIREDVIDSYGYLVSMGLSVTLIDERGTVIA